jgi:putative ABC transport system substrate-binding protein
MRGSGAALGACLALLIAVGTPEAAAAPVAKLLHVCDCPPSASADERTELLAALSALGYVQGRNLDLVTHDVTAVQGTYAEFLGREVALKKPDVVLASGVRVAEGAKAAASMPPVVFWRLTDPVGHGLVASLAQPRGNLTGFSAGIEKLAAKRLELLHEMLPQARRVGFVYVSDQPTHAQQAAEVQAAARAIGVELREYSLPESRWSEQPLDALFSRMRRERIEAILLPDLNMLPRLPVELAARYRFPTIHSLTHVVTEWGGLAAYSTVTFDGVRVAAAYADRILRGARPADLPVQEPQLYEFVLNERAARDLGVSFPQASRMRATRILSN